MSPSPFGVEQILRNRYVSGDMYTSIGPVLIAVNPYTQLVKGGKGIYAPGVRDYYHRKVRGGVLTVYVFRSSGGALLMGVVGRGGNLLYDVFFFTIVFQRCTCWAGFEGGLDLDCTYILMLRTYCTLRYVTLRTYVRLCGGFVVVCVCGAFGKNQTNGVVSL